MAKKTKRTHSKEVITLGIIFVALLGLVAVMVLIRHSGDNRDRASSSTGTAKYSFVLPNSATTMAPGLPTTVTIQASGTGQSMIDGFQLIATITGSVPSTVTFAPATVNGLSTVAQSVTDVSGGKKLTLAMLTANPQTPFSANGGTVTLGTLSFTAPLSGTMTITIDPQTSKILQSGTGADLLAIPNLISFTSVAATTVPTPTQRPTNTPVATSVATSTPRPTALPTMLPTMTPVVTPRPTAIPVTPPPTVMPTATARPTIRPTATAIPLPTLPPVQTPRPTANPVPSRGNLRELIRAWIIRWRQSR